MKLEQMIFTLVLRLVGLVGMLRLVRHWAGLYHRNGSVHFDRPDLLLLELLLFAFGVYLAYGAPVVVRFLFPKKPDENGKDNPPR